MGKSSPKTRKFEDSYISKILLLHSGKLALLNLDKIEIISKETLKIEMIISLDSMKDLYQISNSDLIIISDTGFTVLSLKENNQYEIKQKIRIESSINIEKLIEINNKLYIFGLNKDNNPIINIYQKINSNSKEFYQHITLFKIPFYYFFFYVEYLDVTKEILLLYQTLIFIDIKTYKINHEIKNQHLYLTGIKDAICILNENLVLIACHAGFYFLNAKLHQIVTYVKLENKIKMLKMFKKDLNGNIIVIADDFEDKEEHLMTHYFFIVYKCDNNCKLTKIYEKTTTDRYIDFVCLDKNQIAFSMSYFPFFSGDEKNYIKISNFVFKS